MSSVKKINILFVLPNFDTGGSEKLVMDLVQHIDKAKFNPAVCVFFTGTYEKKIRELGIPFYVVHSNNKKRSKFYIIRFLNRIIREQKIQVVNTHHTSSLLQGLLSFKLFNRVVLIHTEHTRIDLDPAVNKRILNVQKLFLRYVDFALGISKGVCDYFENEMGVSKNKIVKILNGVDIKKFQFSDVEGRELRRVYREKIGINDEHIVIGMCANFRAQKNHKLMIRAFSRLKKRCPLVKLVLAGDSPERIDIQKLTSTLGIKYADLSSPNADALESPDIFFLGSRHDIPELMNSFDIYCLPSFFEGLPFSVMEAMASRLPVVATNVEGNHEVVKDGVTGHLVESNNDDQLVMALEKIIKDKELYDTLSANALKYVKEFSFDKMVSKYNELFAKLG